MDSPGQSFEEALRQHIANEDAYNEETRQAILGLINDVRVIKEGVEANRQAIKPWNEFAVSMEQVGRVGRVIRAIIGWCVLVIGTLTFAYVAVKGNK